MWNDNLPADNFSFLFVEADQERCADVDMQQIAARIMNENRELRSTLEELRNSLNNYKALVDNTIEGIFRWSYDGKLLFANRAFANTFGYPSVGELFAAAGDAPLRFCTATDKNVLLSTLEQYGKITDFELRSAKVDGTPIWIGLHARRVDDALGRPAHYEAFIENITLRKLTEEKLNYQSLHDPLTNLANRALFHDRLNTALLRAARQPGYRFSVIYLNLDRFKSVNDNFGRGTGDDVLCHAAAVIKSCLRELDTVARFGADEFAVLVENVTRNGDTLRVAKRIYKTLSSPFIVAGGAEISIGAGLGIVLHGESYDQPDSLLRDADMAMYRAKASARLNIAIFNTKMRDDTVPTFTYENALRQGLASGAFSLHYQPIVRMDNGALHGFEALLRWNNNGQAVPPAVFIPIAEECGFINNLGLFVIEEVCSQLAEWSKKKPISFITHLNISGQQLKVPRFYNEVRKILHGTQIDPSLLLFEITESVLMDDSITCLQSINNIRKLGIKFCLDDFGTGYSSLNYLRSLPLSCIKVDKSFVTEIEYDDKALMIIRNLLKMGGDLNMPLIVEGIERQEQADILLGAGCCFAQGFLYYRPLPASEAGRLIEAGASVFSGAS
jgi:diguanylate cyclase (GGDEF)-like protein/PAS domain S-box-containing protein